MADFTQAIRRGAGVLCGQRISRSQDLGYERDVLLTYLAAFAVASSNAFTPDGTDGHFEWCIAQLGREEVLTALGR